MKFKKATLLRFLQKETLFIWANNKYLLGNPRQNVIESGYVNKENKLKPKFQFKLDIDGLSTALTYINGNNKS